MARLTPHQLALVMARMRGSGPVDVLLDAVKPEHVVRVWPSGADPGIGFSVGALPVLERLLERYERVDQGDEWMWPDVDGLMVVVAKRRGR